MLPEYRGFGKSEGHPSEATFYSDAEVAMEFLRQRNDVGEIVIFGRSLGNFFLHKNRQFTSNLHFGSIVPDHLHRKEISQSIKDRNQVERTRNIEYMSHNHFE